MDEDLEHLLLRQFKERLSALEALLAETDLRVAGWLLRFYSMADALLGVQAEREGRPEFRALIRRGTSRTFSLASNERWEEETGRCWRRSSMPARCWLRGWNADGESTGCTFACQP